MKTNKVKNICYIFIAIISLSACNQNNKTTLDSVTTTESTDAAAPSMELQKDEADRIVIKTANVNIAVDNVQQEVIALQQKINTLNGHVYHYEIKNEQLLQQTVAKNTDSNYNIYNITPVGTMKVKVPRSQSDEFVNYVLQMKGQLSTFVLDEEDITEDIEANKDLTNMYAGAKATPKQKLKTTIANSEEYIAHKKEFKKQNYKSSFLWFDVNLTGAPYVYKVVTISNKPLRDPLSYTFVESLKSGAYFCIDILLGLLKIWPAILLCIGIIYVFKKYIFNKKDVITLLK